MLEIHQLVNEVVNSPLIWIGCAAGLSKLANVVSNRLLDEEGTYEDSPLEMDSNESKEMNVTRPGVNGSTRYTINDNLVFFHQFDIETWWANWEKYAITNRVTAAYYFPDDRTMAVAVARVHPNDRYVRTEGNNRAFDRLISEGKDGTKETYSFNLVHLDDIIQPFEAFATVDAERFLAKLFNAKTRQEFISNAVANVAANGFRGMGHEYIRQEIERLAYASLYFHEAEVTKAFLGQKAECAYTLKAEGLFDIGVRYTTANNLFPILSENLMKVITKDQRAAEAAVKLAERLAKAAEKQAARKELSRASYQAKLASGELKAKTEVAELNVPEVASTSATEVTQ